MARFATASSTMVDELILKSKNENTEKATTNWMKVYWTWAELRKKEKNIESLPPKDLDNTLQYYYAEVKKQTKKYKQTKAQTLI